MGWVTKKKTILIVAFVAAVSAPQIYLVPVMMSGHKRVYSGELILRDPSFATGRAANDWKLRHAYTSGNELVREWDDRRGAVLYETVSRYGNPVKADWYYWFDDPMSGYEGTWLPGHFYKSTFADRSKSRCEIGAPSRGCERWEYWARYGQYLVKVGYDSIGDGAMQLDGNAFALRVERVDELISEVLK